MIDFIKANVTLKFMIVALSSAFFATSGLAKERIDKTASGRIVFTNIPTSPVLSLNKAPATSGQAVKTTQITQKSINKTLTITAEQRKLYSESIQKAATTYSLDPDLIRAVIRIESNFNPKAKSNKNAAGLMQLIPGTAQLMGVKNVFDPDQNIMGGSRYLREMLNIFGGNLKLALAAYNAGPKAVSKHGGVPPYAETQAYVALINGLYKGDLTEAVKYLAFLDDNGTLTFTNLSD